MPDPDFQLTANLNFRSEDGLTLDVHQVADLVKKKIPSAIIDFDRGRENVLATIDRLRALNAPEVIYRGASQRLDQTICIEIPLPDHGSQLVGYTSGFSYYDGCIELECSPFSISALTNGSVLVAKALDLELSLSSQDDLEIGILLLPGNRPVKEIVAEQFADLVQVSGVRCVSANWRSRLAIACAKWLNEHLAPQTSDRWRKVLPNSETLGRLLIHRLESMGSVRKAQVVDFDREFWHSCLLFEYDAWTGLVNFSGHPVSLLDLP